MHFLIVVPIRLDIEHYRWKSGGNRRRREQDMTNEIESARVAALGDGSNVPQNRSSRVEIGRLDEEKTPFLVFGRDLCEHVVVAFSPANMKLATKTLLSLEVTTSGISPQSISFLPKPIPQFWNSLLR